MGVSVKTRVLLWGRSGYRCAFPDCRKELVVDATQTDDESLIGDVAHIVASSPEGPRGKEELSVERRDKYDNLILLCKNHHKVVDDQPEKYVTPLLRDWKATHEAWVRGSLESYNPREQRVKEIYADIVEEWSARADLEHWTAWTSSLLSHGQPSLERDRLERLEALDRWLFNRVWPHEFDDLEAAFENFRRVVNVLRNEFAKRTEDHGGVLRTEKFYRRAERFGKFERAQKMLQEYEHHVDLIQDLTLELTRAGNYVCDRVRESIDPIFRLQQGVLVAESGPHMDMTFRMRRVEYRGDGRTMIPFRGLELFASEDRFERDQHFGRKDG